jgi:hypothetical protein
VASYQQAHATTAAKAMTMAQLDLIESTLP